MAADPAPTRAIEGHVERFDGTREISGWAVDRAAPTRPLDVELWAGSDLLASTPTVLPRPDVVAALGSDCHPGFRFDEESLAALHVAAADGLTGTITIKVSGDVVPLPGVAAELSLETIRRGDRTAPNDAAALLQRLSDHKREACSSPMPHRPPANHGAGFVEGVWVDPGGLTWLVGWMIEDALLDRSVVIIDSAVHPAGAAYALADRADLAPGSKAFVAVLSTLWRLDPELTPQFVFTDDSGRFLDALPSNLLMSRRQITPIIQQTLERAREGHSAALRNLFRDTSTWSLDEETADRLHVDEIAILPGFGAFVNGWAVSPSKRGERLTLNAGGDIIRADAPSQIRFNRADVATVYPNVEEALETAGFVATFPTPIDASIQADMTLKVTWHDGSSTNAAIAPVARRVLGLTTPIEAVRRFYPAVEAEGFFGQFAYHAASNARERASLVRTFEINPAPAVLLLAAPDNASDLFLLAERVMRRARDLPEHWGVAILAQANALRPLLMSLFADLKGVLGRPCSLLFTHDVAPTTDAIVRAAALLCAERIGWVAPHASLTARGWHAVGTADAPFTILSIEDSSCPRGTGVLETDAFVARLGEWRRLTDGAPPRIGGVRPRFTTAPALVAGAGMALGRPAESSLAAAINRTIAQRHG